MRFRAFLRFELMSCRARIGESLIGAALLLIAVTIFALAQPAGGLSLPTSMAMLWVALFLILSIVQFLIFERDRQSGLLEQWPLLPLSLEWLFIAKTLAHWIAFALPLLLAAPPAMAMLQIAPSAWPQALLALTAGSVSFVFLGAMAAVAALRFRSGETIGILLCLPLSIPVGLFGAATALSQGGTGFLAALTLCIAPLSTAAGAKLLTYAD